jgi:hypothetical protein
MRRLKAESGLLLLGVALFATLLFKHISYPLLWQDEGETVMFATRVVEYGYPKVHGDRNVLYEFGSNIAVGVKESVDAYIGTTWGHFYYAVPGVLWARGSADLHAKTARLRIPFALAGSVGIALWVLALVPVYRGDPRRARAFAGLFLLCAAVSISLLLHLREARYYPLLILLTGAIANLQLRRRIAGGAGGPRHAVGLAALLLLVFHTFFAAYFYLAALLAVDAVVVARGERPGARGQRALREVAPILGSALLVAPGAVYFETFAIAAAFRADLGFSLAGWADNAAFFLRHFWRFEFLAPALACRLAVVAVDLVARRRGLPPDPGPARRVSVRLAWFVAGYAAVTCVNPLVYERYFVVLSPAVIGMFLLDAFSLLESLPRLVPGQGRRAAVAAGVAVAAIVGLSSASRVEAVRGRFEEIAQPVDGPLDVAIARLAEVPEPAQLVIATNYANHPLMYYLGSHVIVGTNLNNIVRERSLEPDVVIPRRRWPRGLAELRAYLQHGEWTRERLPVPDVHFNNVPALSRSASTPDVHRFRTPEPGRGAEAVDLEIFWRKGGRGDLQPRPGTAEAEE